jgi:hypothetical protein
MKRLTLLALIIGASSLNAQSFIAGFDFDGTVQDASSITANWGAQIGSATLAWSHAQVNIPVTFNAEFGISTANNSAVINDTFTFLEGNVDSITGFNQFSDGPFVLVAEQGFQSFTGDDTLTLSFNGTLWTDLSLSYAFAPTQGGSFSVQTVDLTSFNGVTAAEYVFTPSLNGVYDNFALVGTAVPEPSTYGAIFGTIALAFAISRRRRS